MNIFWHSCCNSEGEAFGLRNSRPDGRQHKSRQSGQAVRRENSDGAGPISARLGRHFACA